MFKGRLKNPTINAKIGVWIRLALERFGQVGPGSRDGKLD